MIRKCIDRTAAVILVLMAAAAGGAHALTLTWSGDGDWHGDPSNWTGGSVPGNGDSVTIQGNVSLQASSAQLAAYTLDAGYTNGFMGTNTFLRATNITIHGTITHSNNTATATNALGLWPVDNRVAIRCYGDMTVTSNGIIDVDKKGFAGGEVNAPGKGPGGGNSSWVSGSGAGHGAYGGAGGSRGGDAYGTLTAPEMPGSGGGAGGGTSYPGHPGGGIVRVEADGRVTIDGTISSCGGFAWGTGGGAGGSIYITCGTIDGSGALRANGGRRYESRGGGGAGGRIAVVCNDPTSQAGLAPTLRFNADGGTVPGQYAGDTSDPDRYMTGKPDGGLGSVYLSTPGIFPRTTTLTGGGVLTVPGFTSWSVSSLTVTDGGIQFPEGFELTVTNDLLIANAGGLGLSGSALRIGGNLTVTNKSSLFAFAAATNAAFPPYGALVSVTGDVTIASGDYNPVAHGTNGAVVRLDCRNFTVAAGGTVDAFGRGFTSRFGPGAGTGYGSGGSYGGKGGYTTVPTYGSPSAPVLPGSPGSSDYRSPGGGSVWVRAKERITVDGTINANGRRANAGWGAGAGAGGGVFLQCDTFDGTGSISADGADGLTYSGGGGGGGRISIAYTNLAAQAFLTPTVTVSARGGTAQPNKVYVGERGTLYLPDTSFLPSEYLANHNYLFMSPGFTSWSPNSLTLTNSSIRFEDGFSLNVVNDLVIFGDPNTYRSGLKCLDMRDHFTLSCGGDFVLTNGAALHAYAGHTNGTSHVHGGSVEVGGSLIVHTNSYIYPFANTTNGGSIYFEVKDMDLRRGGVINADEKGFATGYGPGKPVGSYGGAGYGGQGGFAGRGGPACGSSNYPALPGSGAGVVGGPGGGCVWIKALRNMTVDGTITANGRVATSWGGGCSSGGGIYLHTRRILGSGTLRANGGNSNITYTQNGGGGGGRIAVWWKTDLWTGSTPGTNWCAGGIGYPNPNNNGEFGTVVWKQLPREGTLVILQ